MFYDTLTQLCKAMGVKLTPLPNELGLSPSAIARWRDGAVPNGSTLKILADYFDVTTDYLLGLETRGDFDERRLDGLLFALYKEAHDLTDGEKRRVIEFARFIKEKRRKADR
jgi:transcriptional regulator with XRE-family HTH domain